MFCCDGFSDLVHNIGKRGLSAVPIEDQRHPYFMLRARSCDRAEISSFSSEQIRSLPITKLIAVIDTGMPFCFTCGANLTAWIRDHRDEFDALLAQIKSVGEPTSW